MYKINKLKAKKIKNLTAEQNLHIKMVKWNGQYELKQKSSKVDHEHGIILSQFSLNLNCWLDIYLQLL